MHPGDEASLRADRKSDGLDEKASEDELIGADDGT